jgi:hypothetical protein
LQALLVAQPHLGAAANGAHLHPCKRIHSRGPTPLACLTGVEAGGSMRPGCWQAAPTFWSW